MTPQHPHEAPTLFAGMARSGTTWLGELSKRYLHVAAVNEGCFEFWLARQDWTPGQLGDDSNYDALLGRLAQHLYFQFLYGIEHNERTIVRELKPLIAERSIQGIALGALRLAARRWNLPRLGHEDPTFMDDLPLLTRIYPGCRIVHIVRDPRDVTASVLSFPWGPNNVVVSAADWNRKVQLARELGASLGSGRYLEIRYEDLLQSPRETMTALMRFVRGVVDESRLQDFLQVMDKNPKRSNFGNWRRRLTAHQIQLVEAAAREQMLASGYVPEQPPTTLSPATLKMWRLHHRAMQVRNIIMGRLELNGSGIPVAGEAAR